MTVQAFCAFGLQSITAQTKFYTSGKSFMKPSFEFVAAVPVLASLDIKRSVEFFVAKLGFTEVHVAVGASGIVSNGPVQIHFWACADRFIAEATSCRV